jgi:hypothetical protein
MPSTARSLSAVVVLPGLAVRPHLGLAARCRSATSPHLAGTAGDGGIGELEHAPSIAHLVASRN